MIMMSKYVKTCITNKDEAKKHGEMGDQET